MSARRTNVPAIPAITGTSPNEIAAAVRALKEATEVGYGRRGDPLDRFLTARDLADAGVIKVAGGVGGGISVIGPGGGDGIDDDDPGSGLPDNRPPDYGENDPTVPPAPTGLQVASIPPNKLMVSWTPANYGNHSYAEVYAIQRASAFSPEPTLAMLRSMSATFDETKPHSATNAHPAFLGVASGSFYVRPEGFPRDGGDPFSQPQWYFFVRFVSLARVVGPLAPNGIGVMGQLSLDPAQTLDAIIGGVRTSLIYREFQEFLGSDPAKMEIIKRDGGITAVYDKVIRTDNEIGRLWTVRMEEFSPNTGVYYAAGFGLSIEEDRATGRGSSTFAVQADRFAVMGGGTRWWRVVSYEYIGINLAGDPLARVTAQTSNVFNVGDRLIMRAMKPVIREDGGDQDFPLNNIEARVTAVAQQGGNVVLTLVSIASTPGNPVPVWPAQGYFENSAQEALRPSTYGLLLGYATNVPFVIDTVNNIVGIRGRLVVDGLIRATDAEFDRLRANAAFMSFVRTEFLDANVVVGQKIICGPGLDAPSVENSGTIINDQLNQVNAFVVELSRVQPGGFPFRIYNPFRASQGQSDADILSFFAGQGDYQGINRPRLFLRGDLAVGGNGTFNMTDGGALMIGGRVNWTAPSGAVLSRKITFWAGPDSAYRGAPENRGLPDAGNTMLDNGFFWLSNNPQTGQMEAAFNADLFLNGTPLKQPMLATGQTPIYINGDINFEYRGNGNGATHLRNNGLRAASLVKFAQSDGTVEIKGRVGDNTNPTIMAMASATIARWNGSAADEDKRFVVTLFLRDQSVPEGQANRDYFIHSIELDDYFPESYGATLMGVRAIPPGIYRVMIAVSNLNTNSGVPLEGAQHPGLMSILNGWTSFVQYVSDGGSIRLR